MNTAEMRLDDTKSVIASARAKIWPLAIGLILTLFSVISPQFETVNTLTEKRETKTFIKEKIEGTRRIDARGILQSPSKRARLNHFRNRLNSELAELRADKLKDVPFEPFGVKFTVPFEYAPLIWNVLGTVLVFVVVSARQRGLNFLANAVAASPKPSVKSGDAHLFAAPPVWFAPVWLSDDLESVDKAGLLRALGWSCWHNRIFAAVTGVFLFATLAAQTWVAYIGHQTFLARCPFERAFILWPVKNGTTVTACDLSWAQTLSVVGEIAILALSISFVIAWVFPVKVRRLKDPPNNFLLFGRRTALQGLGVALIFGATLAYAGAPRAWGNLRRRGYRMRRAIFCADSLRYRPRGKTKTIMPNLEPGFYLNRNTGVVHAVELPLPDCPSPNRYMGKARLFESSYEKEEPRSCMKPPKTSTGPTVHTLTMPFVRDLPKSHLPAIFDRLSFDELRRAFDDSQSRQQRSASLRPGWTSTFIETSALQLWLVGDREQAIMLLIVALRQDLARRGNGLRPNVRLLDLAAGLAFRGGFKSQFITIRNLARDNARQHHGLLERIAKWDQSPGEIVDEMAKFRWQRWRRKWSSARVVWHLPGVRVGCGLFML